MKAPEDVLACGANADVDYCDECIDAYRNGIEPGESACDRRAHTSSLANADAIPPHGDFYVTVRDAGRTGYLLGPYEDLREALANVERGAALARSADPWAAFYTYGTARATIGAPITPVFQPA